MSSYGRKGVETFNVKVGLLNCERFINYGFSEFFRIVLLILGLRIRAYATYFLQTVKSLLLHINRLLLVKTEALFLFVVLVELHEVSLFPHSFFFCEVNFCGVTPRNRPFINEFMSAFSSKRV